MGPHRGRAHPGRPGPRPSAGELLEHLQPRIAHFKHPRVIEFRDELPRTPTGKLSRSKVRETYLSEKSEKSEKESLTTD
nr:hypothetical protein GCM10020093_042290 [Planobispora longispora]